MDDSVAVQLNAVPPSEKRCAVEATIAVIGGKWKPILLFHMLDGALRYSELQRRVPRATDRMLTRSLRELEADGLVSRTVYAEVPVRVEYALTPRGRSLVPILQAMSDWGDDRT
jgi:DNA-binding HxlR family transcriptional regulator